eukprot:3499823-Rhodomonas_salina.3
MLTLMVVGAGGVWYRYYTNYPVLSAVCLRTCYSIPDTVPGYPAVWSLPCSWYWPSVRLRTCYAVSGTD